MKKHLVMAMMLAGMSSLAAAAPTEVVLTVGTAAGVGTGTAGQFTLTGATGQLVGSKFYPTQAGQDASYVKVSFTVTGGANVLSYARIDNASQFTATATSTKGNQAFGGNTTAGAVKLIGACAATPCASTDVDGSSAAFTAASSM